MVSVSSQVGAPLKFIEKSVPGTRGGLAGVTPSAWKICALSICGVEEHMPPVGLLLGSRSRIVAFHASLVPLFRISRPNCPGCPTTIVAGPDLVNTRLGAAMVSGGDETPCSPGSGKWKVPPMVVPNVQLAVLENCVPGEFGGTALLSTTVTLSTICCPAGIGGKPLKVSSPLAFVTVKGTGAPLPFQAALLFT